MLQKITKAPTKYYQLLLLNIGLIIALNKQMTLIGIISSLVFVALTLAPFATYFGIISPPPHEIIQDELCNKLKDYHKNMCEFIEKWKEEQPQKKMLLPIKLLLSIYVSYILLCPCLQNFLIVNIFFIYFFMQEEFEYARNFICKCCEGKCPVQH